MAVPTITFWGSDPIALPLLQWLADEAADAVRLAGVVTQPDRRSGRGQRLQANAIKQWALERNLEVRQPERPGPAEAEWVRERGDAVALVMAYGHLLPNAVLEAPVHGMWNFHGSRLPALRGASPLETALALGNTETAMTLMRIVRRLDAGPVADSVLLPVGPQETAPGLRKRAGYACVPLLQRNWEGLCDGTLETVPQDETVATYCRKLSRADGILDFRLAATELERRHRACMPWPGTAFYVGQTLLKAGALQVAPAGTAGPPGEITALPDRLRIATGEGALDFFQLQRPGGKMVPVDAFLRGFPMESGTQARLMESQPWVSKRPFPVSKPSR